MNENEKDFYYLLLQPRPYKLNQRYIDKIVYCKFITKEEAINHWPEKYIAPEIK